MAFVIRPEAARTSDPDVRMGRYDKNWLIGVALQRAFSRSRFTGLHGELVPEVDSKTIEFRNIRLRKSKPYCGNHPGACLAGGNRSERSGVWLEGADWAEVNDLINDVLDGLDVSAYVASSSCVIRRGRKRRITYGVMEKVPGHPDWDKNGEDDDYQEWIGLKAPRAEIPMGTPGGVS